jgi:hypothetical protein
MVPAKLPNGKDGFTPVKDGRMFFDDIPHGLCVLWGMAQIMGIPLPHIEQLILENQAMMGFECVRSAF